MKPRVQIENGEPIPGTSTYSARSRHQNPYLITEEMLEERLKHKNTGRYITQLCVAISGIITASFNEEFVYYIFPFSNAWCVDIWN